MDLTTVLLLVAGLVAPGLNSLLKQPLWSSRLNWLVSSLTAAGLGGSVQWLTDGATPQELVQAAFAVYAVSQAVYQAVLRSSSLNELLENLFVRNSEPEVPAAPDAEDKDYMDNIGEEVDDPFGEDN